MKASAFFIALSLAAASLSGTSPAQASDIGVSVSVGDPGFYGRLDIGNTMRPQLVYERPQLVSRPPVYIEQPLYLRVPPGHIHHWSHHCYRYDACGRQVYFVQDNWYQTVYAPSYRRYAPAPVYGWNRYEDRRYRDEHRRWEHERREERREWRREEHGREHGHGHRRDD